MQVFHPRLWSGLGAAVLLSATAACSGEGGEGDPAAAPGSGARGSTAGEGSAPGAASGEGEGVAPVAGSGEGEGGSTAGEGGAAAAYAALPADSRRALRLAHLKGFFLAAQDVGRAQGAEAAATLASQGMLEVFDPAAAQFDTGDFDESALRRAAESGQPGAIGAAIAALDTAQRTAGGDPAAVARGLTSIATGLYGETTANGALDAVEYQHAYGAALALRDHVRRQGSLSGARKDADRFAALWRSPVAPETPAGAPALAEVLAQAARVELALSGA